MDISNFIQLYSLPTGRRLYAARKVLAAAQQRQATDIAKLAEAAIEHDTKTLDLEGEYATGRANVPSAAETKKTRAREMDERLDAAVRGLYAGAEAFVNYGTGSEEYVSARDLLAKAFPAGLGAMTQQAYVEELESVNRLLTQLRGPLASHVQKLSLAKHVSHIEDRLEAFRAELDKDKPETVDFDTVRAARATGQQYIVRLTAKIFGTFDSDSEDDASARQDLFGPIAQQNDRVATYLKGRRRVRDVDPVSGEEDEADRDEQ